jgi:hypothetical protein
MGVLAIRAQSAHLTTGRFGRPELLAFFFLGDVRIVCLARRRLRLVVVAFRSAGLRHPSAGSC